MVCTRAVVIVYFGLPALYKLLVCVPEKVLSAPLLLLPCEGPIVAPGATYMPYVLSVKPLHVI